MKEGDTRKRSPSSGEGRQGMSGRGFATVRLLGSLSSCDNGKKVPDLSFEVPTKLSRIKSSLENMYNLDLRREGILILVNGIEANALDDLETLVQPNDQVVLIPMFHGGLE